MIKRIIEEAVKELQSEVDKLILEEKEMGVKFDHYIKNVDTIDIEMLPDCHQVKLQVRTGEDIYLFLLEGKGVKILADRYTELKAENCRLYKEQDKLLEKIELNDKLKQDNHELISERNHIAAEKHRLKRERDKLFEKHNVLVLEHDSLLEKYKEQEAKIADLQIEKARLEQEKKDLYEHDSKIVNELRINESKYETLKADFENLRKSLGAKSCEQEKKDLLKKIEKLESERDDIRYSRKKVTQMCYELEEKITNLRIEKNRIEADRKRIIEEHKKSDDEQCDRYKALYDEFRHLKQDNDKNIKRNKELNKQIDEMVLNANKKKEEAASEADYSLDEMVKALDKALDGFSERMDKIIKEFGDIFCKGELEVTTEETYEVEEHESYEEPSSRRDILRCAEKCVCGRREQDYGTPESNFKLIADLWNGYLFPSLEYNKDVISPLDVSMMMALLKIARIRNGGGTGDSFVDLAGYAACGGEINAKEKATKAD